MTEIPASGYFVDSARTNAEAKAALDAITNVLRENLGGQASSELTIASGVITPTRAFHSVDTQSDDPADDLQVIAQTNMRDGAVIGISQQDNARVVTVKHANGGTGQILLATSADFVLTHTSVLLLLRRSGTSWVEIGRFYGNQVALMRAYLGLGTAAVVNTGTGDTAVPTNAQLKGTAREYTASQSFDEQALTDGANISWNLATQQVARVTLEGNRTLDDPTNMLQGLPVVLRVIQDASGSRTLAYDTAYKFPGGAPPTLSTAAGAVDILTFMSDGTVMNYMGGQFNLS